MNKEPHVKDPLRFLLHGYSLCNLRGSRKALKAYESIKQKALRMNLEPEEYEQTLRQVSAALGL